MKSWNEFKQDKGLEEQTFFNNPVDDVDRYIRGLGTRLRLLSKEEIADRRQELEELTRLIAWVLK